MRTVLESHFAEIADLDPKGWAGSQSQLKAAAKALRLAAGELENHPVQAALLNGIGEIESTLYRLQSVSKVINLELLDVSSGLEGLIGMLKRLDDEPLSSTDLYCLLKPFAIALNRAVFHHNDLNA